MVSSFPVNFVRVAASPEIFQHVGENIRLRIKVRFVAAPNTTYYAVFHAKHPVREAIVLLIPYDVPSVLPDRPWAQRHGKPRLRVAIPGRPAALQGLVQRDVIFVAYGSSIMGEDGVNHLARILQANTKDAQENPLFRALGVKTSQRRTSASSTCRTTRRRITLMLRASAAGQRALRRHRLLSDEGADRKLVDALPPEARKVVTDQFSYVMDSLVVELSEPVLQRKLDFLRSPGQNVPGPEFHDLPRGQAGADPVSNYAAILRKVCCRKIRRSCKRLRIAGPVARAWRNCWRITSKSRSSSKQEKAIAKLFNAYEDVSFFACRLVPAIRVGRAAGRACMGRSAATRRPPRAHWVSSIFSSTPPTSSRRGEAHKVVDAGRTRLRVRRNPDAVSVSVTDILDRWGYSSYTVYTSSAIKPTMISPRR